MVNSQLRTGGVVDKAVLAAFLDVPRQRFVAPEYESLAYLDRDAPGARGEGPPAAGADDARRGCCRRRRLSLATARSMSAGGSGYGAAILDAMGAKVVLLESDAGRGGGGEDGASQPQERRRGHGPARQRGRRVLGLSTSSSLRARSASFPHSLLGPAGRPGTSRRRRRVLRARPRRSFMKNSAGRSAGERCSRRRPMSWTASSPGRASPSEPSSWARRTTVARRQVSHLCDARRKNGRRAVGLAPASVARRGFLRL